MRPPGYENHAAGRSPLYETSDGAVTISPAEHRSTQAQVAARRASWQGQGRMDRGTPRSAPDTATLAMHADWQTEQLQMRLRLLELGA